MKSRTSTFQVLDSTDTQHRVEKKKGEKDKVQNLIEMVDSSYFIFVTKKKTLMVYVPIIM